MLESNINIQYVVKNGLCTLCGTCAALCPNDAIRMNLDSKKGIYVPLINETCVKCSTCLKVCPGHFVDFPQLNTVLFREQPDDNVMGNFISCYTGNSTNEQLRLDSSSGGVINQILISALEDGVIDGALVTRMSKKLPWKPKPFIARTKDEIIESANAKYCPVPANIALKEIMGAKKGEKFAVVGLPCHIHGIRKAELINDDLKEKIVLHLGIFCSCGINFLATEYVLKKKGILKDDLKSLNYRGGNFPPGYAKIELNNGQLKEISHVDFWDEIFSAVTFFAPKRCILCYDQTSEFSDISIGSGWFPYLQYKKNNQSLITTRTNLSEDLLETFENKGELNLYKLSNSDVEKIKDLQKFHGFKKRIVPGYLHVRLTLKKKIPDYALDLNPKITLRDYLSFLYMNIRISASSKKYLWGLLYRLRKLMKY